MLINIGDTVRIITSGQYCEVVEVHSDHGFCYVAFFEDGSEGTFCFDELEVISVHQSG